MHVDVTPIDTAGEIAALAEGRSTYTLLTYGTELVHRDQHRIRGGHLRGTTHRQHRCPDRQADQSMRAEMAERRRHGKTARHQRREQQIMEGR